MPIIGLFFETDKCSINEMKETLDKVELIVKDEIKGEKVGVLIAGDMAILNLMMGDLEKEE